MKVLVVGSAGLVGNALVRTWQGRGAQVWAADVQTAPAPRRLRLDMCEERSVHAALEKITPDVVAVSAANPYVDYCELHPEETRRVNVSGTLNVARACRELGARMIFFSSDYVFDGAKGNYDEEDAVCPLNEYGRQKAETEECILALSSNNLVIRTASAYGWQREPKNFALQVMKKLLNGEAMPVVSDRHVSPTYAENLAEVTAGLAGMAVDGIFHVVGSDHLTRYEFAHIVAHVFGLDGSRLSPAPAAQFEAPAKRPQDAVLLTDKVRKIVPTPLVGARQGLAHMRSHDPGPEFRKLKAPKW